MTTFQDPPPHSRRAVRQSERGESAPQTSPNPTTDEQDAPVGDSSMTGSTASVPQAPESPESPVRPDPAQYIFDPSAGHAHVADSSSADQDAPPAGGAHIGRRQARAAAPTDADNSRPIGSLPGPGESTDQSSYRVRDYSPEGGRRVAPPAPTASFAPPARPVELDYQTQGVMPSAVSHSASLPLEDTLNHTLSRRELREMRAAAEAKNPPPPLVQPAEKLPEPIDTLLNSGPIDIPTLAPPPGQSQALAEAMAEFDLLTRSRREAEARARDAQVASLATPIVPQARQPQLPFVPEAADQAAAPQAAAPWAAATAAPAVASAPETVSAPDPAVVQASAPVPYPTSVPQPFPTSAPAQASTPAQYPPTASTPSAPAPVASAPQVASEPIAPVPLSSVPLSSVPLNSVPLNSEPDVLAPPSFQAQSVPQPPVAQQSAPDGVSQADDQHGGRSPRASNHWRVQAAIEDGETPYENTLSRTVGSNTSAITTSALVLPSVPQPGGGILNAMTATGEILVTGTIDLPKSLGSTGAHPNRVDNSDFEDDPLDNQVAAPDSAPVRAIRAISTNTSTRGVIETKKPQGTRALTAVIAIASTLCVGLVVLLVVAFASGKL